VGQSPEYRAIAGEKDRAGDQQALQSDTLRHQYVARHHQGHD
jgi:hypothetical protein